MLVIKRDNTGGPSFRATFYGRGRDIPEIETAIEFVDEDYRWKILGEAGQVADTVEQQEILDLLREADENLRLADIAGELGKSTPNVSKMLRKLIAEGLVTKPATGRYAAVKTVKTVNVGDNRGPALTESTELTAGQRCAGAGCDWCAAVAA